MVCNFRPAKIAKQCNTGGNRIDQCSSFQICQETAARDGLMKMKQVYESNPALGDPMSIQGQLTDSEQRLTKLQSEKKKFQVQDMSFEFDKAIHRSKLITILTPLIFLKN